MTTIPIQLQLANPRGFCAGVDRAIAIVERALEKFGAPVYVRHEIVHNTHVVANLKQRGAIFIEDLHEVPKGAVLVFSAHGVPLAVREEAAKIGLQVFDATCPLVTKVHVEVEKMRKDGCRLIMIGHKGHPEVEGTMGQIQHGDDPIYLVETVQDVAKLPFSEHDRVAYVTQTTLSVDDTAHIVKAIQQRFPSVSEPKKQDICYATQNRQDAIKQLCAKADLILIVGSPSSSNSNRLREVVEKNGVIAHMIDSASDLDPAWLQGIQRVGLSAGASAPEVLVQEVVTRLRQLGVQEVIEQPGEIETVSFPMPKGLSDRKTTAR